MDIVSLDIQRSRDHGIPSYTQYRKYCGLKEIQSVQDLAQVMVKGVNINIYIYIIKIIYCTNYFMYMYLVNK